jgi:Fe-S-cluster containining protein
MTDPKAWEREASALFRDARDPRALDVAVVTFHRRVDEMVDATMRGHAVKVDCARGCSFCCHMPVQATPHEAFTLAAWLRRHFDPSRLAAVIGTLKANVAKTRALGTEGRRHVNLACALLGDDGVCSAYEARPAQCRRFHSMRVETCKASFANPADDAIEAPMHAALAHNVGVVMALAQRGARDAGLDADPVDMNVALLEALENPKSWRRWRDGKKPFVSA